MFVFIAGSAVFYICLGAVLAFTFWRRVAKSEAQQVTCMHHARISRQSTLPAMRAIRAL